MKISDRFTDYGIIGTLFWMLNFGLWMLVGHPGWITHCQELAGLIKSVPPSASSVMVAVLGAAGLAVVFATGLGLDLVASVVFRPMERVIFARQLRAHIHWFRRLTDQHKEYFQSDIEKLLNTPSWNLSNRQAGKAYLRVHSFLLAYVLLTPGVERIELLSAQMSLWSTFRAVATSLIVCSLELYLPLLGIGLHHAVAISPVKVAVWAVVLVCATVGIMLFASRAYDRVTGTLFSMTYIISTRSPA